MFYRTGLSGSLSLRGEKKQKDYFQLGKQWSADYQKAGNLCIGCCSRWLYQLQLLLCKMLCINQITGVFSFQQHCMCTHLYTELVFYTPSLFYITELVAKKLPCMGLRLIWNISMLMNTFGTLQKHQLICWCPVSCLVNGSVWCKLQA